MLISKYIIMDNMTRLKNILKSSSMDEQKRTRMFHDILRETLISIEENAAYFNNYQFAQANQRVLTFKNEFESLDLETLRRRVDELKAFIDATLDYERGSHSDFIFDVRKDNDSKYTLTEADLAHIVNRIDIPNREVKVLDPLCNNETTIRLAAFIHNKRIYGITQDERYDHDITQHMNALAIGRGTKAKITNNVFDMVVMKSKVAWSIDMAMARRILTLKSEKNNFVSNMKYLREGGVAVVILPYGKVTNDMLDAFCRHLENVQIFKPSNELANSCHHVIVMGRKRSLTRKGLDEELYNHLKSTYITYDSVPYIHQDNNKIYRIPPAGLTVEHFRGSIIDEATVVAVLNNTSILNQLLEEKRHEDDSISDVRPPLPFNTGQIGLVLTSGCLDGVIEEGDGNYHVIKGRVVKSSVRTQEEVDEATYDTIETINNKVEISVMLPNGEYRVLA